MGTTVPTCAVEDCDRLVTARGWCPKHYQRWWATGSVELRPPAPRCEVDWCTRPAKRDQRCNHHFGVQERHPVDWANPLVCDCETPVADPARDFGMCQLCKRKPLALMAARS
jgi:hypothetical protein